MQHFIIFYRKESFQQIAELKKELEVVKMQRDNLLIEKEWNEERIQLKKEIVALVTRMRYALSKYFPPSQVEHIVSGTPLKYWSDDDVSKAITLRSLSPKTYKFESQNVQVFV